MISIGFVIMLACVVFFYRAGQMEGKSGILWALMSVVVWRVTPHVLGDGLLSQIAGQVGLFIGIAVFRVLLDELKKRRGT
jgi:predicted cobalt transporter CbtA